MKLKPSWWDVVFVGYMMTLGLALTLFLTFMKAYFSGKFMITVIINAIGEAHIELILICFIMVLSFVGLYGLLKLQHSGIKANERIQQPR